MINQINFKTKEAYTNSNAYVLATVQDDNSNFSNEWLTFVQAKELGKQIIKGSKGVQLQRVITVNNKGKDEQRVTRFTVFNIMQTKDIEIIEGWNQQTRELLDAMKIR